VSSRRAVWDLTIWVAALVYIALVLWLNLDTPLVGLLLIGLAVYELIARHE
jgi:hypothetical protein